MQPMSQADRERSIALAQANIGNEATRVLLTLLYINNDDRVSIVVPQARIARYLRMHPSNVSRAVSRLVREGVLLKGPKVLGLQTHRLNPDFGKRRAPARVININEHRTAT